MYKCVLTLHTVMPSSFISIALEDPVHFSLSLFLTFTLILLTMPYSVLSHFP